MSQVPTSSLKPLTKRRLGTFSLTKHFGTLALPQLPATLGRTRFPLPDQFNSEFCTAFGESVSSMFKYARSMSPEWQTAMEGRFYRNPITNGADAAGSMDAAILNGSLPKEDNDMRYTGTNDALIADWNNYSPDLQKQALPFPPGIPYKVDGPYDVFTNIQVALSNSQDRAVVKAFGHWYQSFNEGASNPKGILATPTDQPITLHRYNFVDWVTEGENVYLVAALTQGQDFGDNGYLYMDRDCVNFIFKDMAENGLGLYISRPASFNWPTTIAYLRIILSRLAL